MIISRRQSRSAGPEPLWTPKRRNWLLFVLLAALAACMYLGVMAKIANFGF
ncbi:MAG: hypothetical protein JO312_15780 [Hyphomicrobiales bacterium]|nr:hypothetical protein [Hyphomicrobiales bacterium]